ncbi:translation termination factor eRF1 [Coemansia sp. D1744]|nr:translation termination factor eRF1 [Coemansia sp. RSA 1878]KAJ2718021.1 translation termination factor eRF1 [Coemansia sp. D1744]
MSGVSDLQRWKLKRLIKTLEAARGSGTSMISLAIPPKQQISQVVTMLTEEFGTASNIKSRVNRQSVLSAITSAQHRLKLYPRTPPNGLVVYCGTVLTDDGKEKLVNIDFEPFKPVSTKLYLCDSKFHLEPLAGLLEDSTKFGFIVIDGKGSLYGQLSGNTRETLHQFSVELPKKHGRGGQSSMRFGRIRLEKRQNYVRKVAEKATQLFITNNAINVTGLILAGSAEFKEELEKSDIFDPRLRSKVIQLVDVAYGGENGFSEAISLSRKYLDNVKVVQEQELVTKFFDEIARNTGKISYGIDDIISALEDGAVETLIVWENLVAWRVEFQDAEGTKTVRFLRSEQEHECVNAVDKVTGAQLEIVSKESLVDWLAEAYTNFGTNLEIIGDSAPEATSFINGFGGIGGLLRWKREEFDIQESDSEDYFEENDPDDEYAEFF